MASPPPRLLLLLLLILLLPHPCLPASPLRLLERSLSAAASSTKVFGDTAGAVTHTLAKLGARAIKAPAPAGAGGIVGAGLTVVRGIGESVLLVGAAAETVASGTAGVAEDTIRLLQEAVGALADKLESKADAPPPPSPPPPPAFENLPYYSWSLDSAPPSPPAPPRSLLQHAYNQISSTLSSCFSPSPPLSPLPLLSSLLLLFLLELLIRSLSSRRAAARARRAPPPNSPNSKVPILVASMVDPSSPPPLPPSLLPRLLSLLLSLLLSPFRLLLTVLLSPSFLSLLSHALLFLLLLDAAHTSHLSATKAGETKGFRRAVATLTAASRQDSALWANGLLGEVWRVEERGYRPQYDISEVDERTMKAESKLHYPSAAPSPSGFSYGGLEPYLSSTISSLISSSLEHKMSLADDETVAYLHLHSFTLGSAPPLLKSIRSHPGGLTLELDYTNSDVSLVVALKLSSMDHVLLPTTLLEVADLQMNMPVKVGVQVDPDYPFIKSLNFSLPSSFMSGLSFAVKPADSSSGMQNLNLNNIPGVMAWIKESVEPAVEEMFIEPNYLSVDLPQYLATSFYTDAIKFCDRRLRSGQGPISGGVKALGAEDTKDLLVKPQEGAGGNPLVVNDPQPIAQALNMRNIAELTRIIEEEVYADSQKQNPVRKRQPAKRRRIKGPVQVIGEVVSSCKAGGRRVVRAVKWIWRSWRGNGVEGGGEGSHNST